ncbi:MAG TPA: TrmH family RNA methyltransferase [Rhizomicrobium sp.]|jgi:tRNA (cytidine/uridine-2'-O-)-methyltransferase|nr:TrmH family RNA methyltransferase [Rhizomicrobium sp.]
MRLALFEPDIPQNAGTLIRLGACLGVGIDIIEPCGFVIGGAAFKRAGMDYLEMAAVTRHTSWTTFCAARAGAAGRLVLLTTKGAGSYIDYAFAPDDTILLGRESAGVPEHVHSAADARLRIPMAPGLRSLNVAVAAAMVVSEALRQTKGFPG